MRDLILINVITALAAINFLLKTKGTSLETATWFYVMSWILSLVMLLFMQLYCGKPTGDYENVTDYDENLRRSNLPWLVGGVAAMVIVSCVIISGFTRSALYVPRPGAVLETAPLSVSAVVDDILYNFVLVAPAEETMKLMGMMALYYKTKNRPLSIGIPSGIWAAFHGYFAYVGSTAPVLIVSAFVSGVILFVVMWKTGALLNAQIAHGSFNTIVILSSLF